MKIGRIRTVDGPRFITRRDETWLEMEPVRSDLRGVIENIGIPGEPVHVDDAALLCPIVMPTKVIGIGLNYLDHIRETGAKQPSQPVVFAKFPNSLTGPRDNIVVDPALTNQADYEIELGVVIGRRSRGIAAANALDAVFGYVIANDLSPRDLQATDPQLSWAKSIDGFCPVGPWITTADEIRDPQGLGIRSEVNGRTRQSSSTREMLYSVADLIAFLSRTMTLFPGDLILTGTPHGVGFTMAPPQFLGEGDIVRGEIDGLGYIENRIVSPIVPEGG